MKLNKLNLTPIFILPFVIWVGIQLSAPWWVIASAWFMFSNNDGISLTIR